MDTATNATESQAIIEAQQTRIAELESELGKYQGVLDAMSDGILILQDTFLIVIKRVSHLEGGQRADSRPFSCGIRPGKTAQWSRFSSHGAGKDTGCSRWNPSTFLGRTNRVTHTH